MSELPKPKESWTKNRPISYLDLWAELCKKDPSALEEYRKFRREYQVQFPEKPKGIEKEEEK